MHLLSAASQGRLRRPTSYKSSHDAMRHAVRNIVSGAVVAAVLYLSLGPIITLLVSSVNSTRTSLPFETNTITLENYVRLLTDGRTYSFLANTAIFAVGSLVLSFVVAFVLAWLVERTDMPGRRLSYVLVLVPLAIPGALSAISWVLLFGPAGLISLKLHVLFPAWQNPLNVYSMTGMIIVGGLMQVPIMFLSIAPALSRMDPSLEEQSWVSGRAKVHTVIAITMQVLRPALLAAVLIAAIMLIETLDVPIIIGPTAHINVFSTYLYNLAQAPNGGLPDYGLASAASAMILVIALIMLAGYGWLTKESHRFVTVSGRGFRARRIELRGKRWLALGGVGLYAIFTLVLPMTVLLWASLLPFLQLPSASALAMASPKIYLSIWSLPKVTDAVVHTLAVALTAATATVALTALTTWLTTGPRSAVQAPVRILAYVPLAIPGLVIGYALLLIHLHWLTFLYGTIWVIALGLVIKGMAYGHRLLEGAYANFDRQLEEASAACGATWQYTLRRVSLPLLAPAMLSVWILMFVFSMRELAIPAQLFAQDNAMVSLTVLQFWNSGAIQNASALGVILVIALGILTFGARTLVDRQEAAYTSGGIA